MAQLIIRVGAAADRSLTEVWRPAIESANRAKAAIEKSARATADSRVRAARTGVSAEEREYQKLVKTTEKWRREEVKAAEKAAKDKQSANAKSAKAELSENERLAAAKARIRDRSAAYAGQVAAKQAAEEARAAAKTTRDLEREMDKRKRDAEKNAREAAKNAAAYNRTMAGVANRASDHRASSRAEESAAMRAGGSRALSLAGSGIGAAVGLAADIAMGLARGAGVDTDFGAMAQKNFELSKSAQDIANSGYMAGDRRNGMRVSAGDLTDDAFRVGKRTGMSADDAMGGLNDFVGKTGDLATGREILTDMAKLSKATGTNLSDMMSAAGGVAMAMGETDDKAGKLNTIMAGFAAQGKLGAVEIKNLATQMDKLSAQAGQFEGNLADNMVMMGTLAQEARQRGGAASATQAATSVAAFTAMLKTPKRAEEFEKATGKKVFNAQGMLRNPQEIILEALRAKGMDPTGFKSIFANAQGGRAVEGFATIYRQAGGGAAGEKAVIEEFDRLKKASIDAAEAQESFALAMKQPKSQAEVFNATLRETTMKMQNELTPAVVALAPAVVEAAKAVASSVTWMTGGSKTQAQVDSSKSNVDSVIAANESAIKTGQVGSGMTELNFKAESDATRTASAAKAEADELRKKEKMGFVGSAMAGLYDNSAPGALFRAGDALFGSGKGNGVGGTIRDSRNKDTVAAEGRSQQADETMKRMHEESMKLNALLANGTIKVKVEGGSVGPPGVSDAGRTPPPGAGQ